MKLKLFFAIFFAAISLCAEVSLFDKVEGIGVSIGGYTLGKTLNPDQKSIAEKNSEQANVAGTYKFKDGDFHIVADLKTDRVVLIYRAYSMVDSDTMKHLVSEYIGTFEEPTTVTHENIIYWFYHEDGHKISLDEFEAWRSQMNPEVMGSEKTLSAVLKSEEGGQKERLHQIVTVKFSTTKPIFTKKEKYLDASAYLMVSSEPLLKAQYNLGR